MTIGRTLALQSFVYAVGNGVFLTGSAVFFVHVVGLKPTQVGVGLSIAGALALLLSVPVGTLTDRVGARRMWLGSSVLEAALFCTYPIIKGFWAFVLIVAALAITGAGSNSGRRVYTVEAVPAEQRVRVMAVSRTALNVGFAVGSLLAGVVLAIGTTAAFDALVLANAAGLVASAVVILRLPDTAREASSGPVKRFVALRDRPFLAVTALCGALLAVGTLETEVLPLWTITQTHAPRTTLAALFILNTTIVVLLQVPAARGGGTLPGAARALRRSGLITALACPILWWSGHVGPVLAVGLLVVSVGLVSGGELFQSTGSWGVTAILPPPGRRGEYLGAFGLGSAAQSMAGPAALTWLAIGTGGWGWLVIAALFVGSGLASAPVVRWASHGPEEGDQSVDRLAERLG
jgi:MFS family permease